MNLFRRLTAIFSRSRLEREMNEELRFHIEAQTQRNLAAGMTPDDAARAARRQFGWEDRIREEARDARGWTWLESLGRDLRLAVRSLRRAPGFSLAVLGTLALCIGPNTAILSALYALVLKPMPFPESERLVTVVNVAEKSGGQVVASSTTQYLDFRAHATLFAGFTAARTATATLDEDTAPRRVKHLLATGDFFDVLGVHPVAGRLFDAEDATEARNNVLVVAEDFWRRHYDADPEVIGSEVSLDGVVLTIVGVAPRCLAAIDKDVCFFRPYVPPASKYDPQSRYRGDLALHGRLKPGVSIESAHTELAALEAAFLDNVASPEVRVFFDNAGFRLALEPLRPGGLIGEKRLLWLLQAGAGFVLLIGFVNVANLFLARMNGRRTELAIRASLGAQARHLLRQALTESFVLTAVATVVGVVAGAATLRILNAYLPLVVPAAPEVALDGTVTTAIAAASAGMAFLLGLIPLRVCSRGVLHAGASRTGTPSAGARALGGILVVSQVAVAAVLLISAGLLLRSFSKVMAVDPGFDAARVVQARIALSSEYRDRAANIAVRQRILDSLRTIPGVENVAETRDAPLASNVRPVPFGVRGTGPGSQPLIHIETVSPEFFATMGMRVLSGRSFTDADEFTANPVAIVDERFVRNYFPDRNVEGMEIYLFRGLPLAVDGWPRIVGVVSRAQLRGLDSQDNLPIVYVPTVGSWSRNFQVLLRTHRAPADVIREVQLQLHAIDPALPIYGTGTLEEQLGDMLLPRQGITVLLGVFSALALLLAAIGLYGVLAYDVSQRTREIGIRGAIGASRGCIVTMILRQGMSKCAIGLALGLPGALVITRSLDAVLYGVSIVDPVSYLAVGIGLIAVAGLASWLPARRAAQIDPMAALRME